MYPLLRGFPKYNVTEQKLLADIYEVAPIKRRKADEKKIFQTEAGAPYHSSVPRPLTDEQVEEAKKELINKDYIHLKFPKQIRMGRDPAIAGQNCAVISFYPSKEAKADNEDRFGTLKIRGVFSSETEAEDRAEMLIRNVDSFSSYFFAPVGVEVSIANDMINYTKSLQEVDIRRKNDKIAKDYIRAKIDEEIKRETRGRR